MCTIVFFFTDIKVLYCMISTYKSQNCIKKILLFLDIRRFFLYNINNIINMEGFLTNKGGLL